MINLAPRFWPIFGLLEPTAAQGALGRAPARKKGQVAHNISPETNHKARSWVFCDFGAGRKKIEI